MSQGRKLVLCALLLALVQTGFLGWMIVGRAAVLRDGREVLLKVEPVDPRDLLRGDYVILNYEISRIPLTIISDIGEAGERLAWLGNPTAGPAGTDEIEIAGQIPPLNLAYIGEEVRVTYGIERFYLPEGEGRAIERDMRVRPFGVRVAVPASGNAQVKALMDGDQVLFQEPLY
jgi:uncharacterized membrane-anchored protein